MGKGYGQGPPFLPAWEAFLAIKGEDVGGAAKLAPAALEEKFKAPTQYEKLVVVRVCMTKVTYDQAFIRITLALRGHLEEQRVLILEVAKQAGGESRFGKASRSNLERQL